MSFKAKGGRGLKALADMSDKNVSVFWTAPLTFHNNSFFCFLSPCMNNIWGWDGQQTGLSQQNHKHQHAVNI